MTKQEFYLAYEDYLKELESPNITHWKESMFESGIDELSNNTFLTKEGLICAQIAKIISKKNPLNDEKVFSLNVDFTKYGDLSNIKELLARHFDTVMFVSSSQYVGVANFYCFDSSIENAIKLSGGIDKFFKKLMNND